MAKRPTITTVTTGHYDTATLNTNFTNIQSHFDNLISRLGDSPNTMAGDMDMNSNDILNVGTMDVANLTVNGVDLTDVVTNPLNGLTLAEGDILYVDSGGDYAVLNIGSDGQVLKISGGLPAWGTDNDTDTDTVGVTVEEDGVQVQTTVTVINFVTGLQATTPIVTSPGAGQVTVDLDALVNP